MKIGMIVAAANSITFAYGLKLRNGGKVLKLRRKLNEFASELKDYDDLKMKSLKDIGKESVKQTDPEFPALVKFLNEALDVESKIKPEAILSIEDFDGTEVSAADLEGLLALGLLADEKPEAAPRAPRTGKK